MCKVQQWWAWWYIDMWYECLVMMWQYLWIYKKHIRECIFCNKSKVWTMSFDLKMFTQCLWCLHYIHATRYTLCCEFIMLMHSVAAVRGSFAAEISFWVAQIPMFAEHITVWPALLISSSILTWQYRHIQVDETDWWLRSSGI